jgi:hypothetical protein
MKMADSIAAQLDEIVASLLLLKSLSSRGLADTVIFQSASFVVFRIANYLPQN